MPQLDFFTYTTIIVCTLVLLLPWCIYIYSVIIPKIGYSLKLRNKILENRIAINNTIRNEDKTSTLILRLLDYEKLYKENK
jgi:hypothetical protein